MRSLLGQIRAVLILKLWHEPANLGNNPTVEWRYTAFASLCTYIPAFLALPRVVTATDLSLIKIRLVKMKTGLTALGLWVSFVSRISANKDIITLNTNREAWIQEATTTLVVPKLPGEVTRSKVYVSHRSQSLSLT